MKKGCPRCSQRVKWKWDSSEKGTGSPYEEEVSLRLAFCTDRIIIVRGVSYKRMDVHEMRRLVESVRLSLSTENWYSALFVALSMPDICGRLEDPTKPSDERYMDWFRRYLSGVYGAPTAEPFLTPEDCYALRCALVHQGAADITGQKKKKILDEICFFRPGSQAFGPLRPGHCNRLTNVRVNDREFKSALCLMVTGFCEDMCKAVEKWLSDVAGNVGIQARMNDLLPIY